MRRKKPGHPPRAAGSRDLLDVLLALGRKPSPEAAARDREAVERGGRRLVSCFVRANFGEYPRAFRQGFLDLGLEASSWRPFAGLERTPLELPPAFSDVRVRPRDPHADRNITSRGLLKAGGLLASSGFVVLACTTPSGSLELAVPRFDEPLVTSVLSRRRRSD